MKGISIVVKIDPELEDIVPGYIDRRKREISDIWDAYNKRDYPALQVFGHKLKGNAGGYGLDHIGALGSEIEVAAKDKSDSKIEHALQELDDYLQHLSVTFDA